MPCQISTGKSMECPYLYFLTSSSESADGIEKSIIFGNTCVMLLPPRPNSCPPRVGEPVDIIIKSPQSPCDMISYNSPITRPHHDIHSGSNVIPVTHTVPINNEHSSTVNSTVDSSVDSSDIATPISFDGPHWTRKKKKYKPQRFNDRYKRVDWRVDKTEVVKFHSDLMFNTVQNVDWHTTTPIRAGVIVYYRSENKINFALGIDINSSNITDFGGGVKYSEENNAVTAALREFKEETCGVFGQVEVSQVGQCKVVVKGTNIMIIFMPLRVDPDDIVRRFDQVQSEATDPELERIIWIDGAEFVHLIIHGRYQKYSLYEPVQDLLSDLYTKYNNFIDLL